MVRLYRYTGTCETLSVRVYLRPFVLYLTVVYSSSAPLTLTNLGQYLIPVSMPGSMIVDFIANTQQQAEERLKDAIS